MDAVQDDGQDDVDQVVFDLENVLVHADLGEREDVLMDDLDVLVEVDQEDVGQMGDQKDVGQMGDQDVQEGEDQHAQ